MDGGKSWSIISALGFAGSLRFVLPDTFWVGGLYYTGASIEKGGFVFSTNGGGDWNRDTSTCEYVYDMVMLDGLTGWLLNKSFDFTGSENILFTSDGGRSWEIYKPNNYYDLEAIAAVDGLKFWGVGPNGTIIHFKKDITGIENINQLNKQEQLALDSYPNPFNSEIKIKYYLPNEGNTKLSLYDALGRKVYTILDQYSSAGEKTIRLSGGGLSSGIYFLILSYDEDRLVHKVMLLK